MSTYYTMIFYIDDYDKNLNQGKITKELVDKICELLGCDYDNLGWILWEPDYPSRQSGRMYKKKNSEMFFKQKIDSVVHPIKHPEEGPSSPCLVYESHTKGCEMAPNFQILIRYSTNIEKFCASIEINVPRKMLKSKKLNINLYNELLTIINKNNFHIHYSLVHYHKNRKDSYALGGISIGIFHTLEEWLIMGKSHLHFFDWKNKVIDVFMFNTITKDSISEECLSKIKKIVGNKNIVFHDKYITFIYPVYKFRYLLDKYLPSIKKIRIRKVLKKFNLLPEKNN